MLDREEVAARLAAAVLQTTPASPGQRPGQSSDMIATCRYAVAVYETILGMLPMAQTGKAGDADRVGDGIGGRFWHCGCLGIRASTLHDAKHIHSDAATSPDKTKKKTNG